MADVKVCDRCGKRLTEDRLEFKLKPVILRYNLSAVLFKRRSYCYVDNVNTEHDLCIDCADKLSEWMKGETEGAANG